MAFFRPTRSPKARSPPTESLVYSTVSSPAALVYSSSYSYAPPLAALPDSSSDCSTALLKYQLEDAPLLLERFSFNSTVSPGCISYTFWPSCAAV